MPIQAQTNNLQLCPGIEELDFFVPNRTYVYISNHPIHINCCKSKRNSTWSQGTVSFSTCKFEKDSDSFLRSYDDEYIILLSLKQDLSDESVFNKQHIRPSLVSKFVPNRTYDYISNHPIHINCRKSKRNSTWSQGKVSFSTYKFEKDSDSFLRSYDDEYIVSLSLKQDLSDKSVFNKQHIRPSLVSKALEKLVENKPFFQQVCLVNSWEDISKESDPQLWELLTDVKPKSKTVEETDNEGDVYSSNNTTENPSVPYPTVLYEEDGPSVSKKISY